MCLRAQFTLRDPPDCPPGLENSTPALPSSAAGSAPAYAVDPVIDPMRPNTEGATATAPRQAERETKRDMERGPTLTERFGAEAALNESPAEFYERMVLEVQDNLAPFAQAIGAHRLIARGQVQLLGTSGTVTTLSGIQMGLPRYDRSVVDGSFPEFGGLRNQP